MEQEKQKNYLKILGGIGLFLLLVVGFFKLLSPEQATISGLVTYNGVQPEDPTKGKVVIEQRELGSDDEFKIAVDNVELKDNEPWAWGKAEEGKTYNIKAYVEHEGKKIAESTIVTVTAPASNQNLVFNVTAEDLPVSTVQGASVTVSGKLDLNGYVPPGSFVNIYAKEGEDGEFVLLSQGIPAEDGRKLSWNAAKAGTFYTFSGDLYDSSGVLIGTSEDLTIVAPASGQIMRIDSTASSPEETGIISGEIIINGPVDVSSTVLMLQRKPGESDYTAFDRIPAASGSKWSFDDALAGQEYEITASLQVDEDNTSVGNVLSVTAPAEDEVITINTNYSLVPPEATPVYSCGNQQGEKWNATVTYQSIEDAGQYYLQVGTTQGGSDLLNEKANATGENVTRNVLVNQGQSNYARYAYTFDTYCNSKQCFSGSSPTLVFKCPN